MAALQPGVQRLVAPYPEALLATHVLPPVLCCAKPTPHSCCPPASGCHQWGRLRPNIQTLHGEGSRGIGWTNTARSISRRKMRRRRDSGGAERSTPARGSCKEPDSWKPKINLNGESICSGDWVNRGKQQQGEEDGAAEELSMQENPQSNESPPQKAPVPETRWW